MIDAALDRMPIVAILRGVEPDEVEAIAAALYEGGVRCIEVPLNSPSPLRSIELLASSLPDDCLVGAGTVIALEDVRRVRDAGGRLIVTPNTSPPVIELAITLDMQVVPGVATPTEAFAAVRSGANYLKLFPASTYGPGHMQAMQAVLPGKVRFLAVGGVGPDNFAEWIEAGAIGIGIGSQLFKAGDGVVDVEKKLVAIGNAMEGTK